MTSDRTSKWLRAFRALLRSGGKVSSHSLVHASDDTRNAGQWGWEENILGICTSSKRDQLCVTFLVEKKIHPSRLTAQQFIPDSLRFRKETKIVPTDVVECGQKFQLQDGYQGTLRIGLPVGHEHGYGSGSLGLLVRPVGGGPGSAMILSCAHVFAWSRKAIFALPLPGDFIEQPVNLDQDPPSLEIARLVPGFTDLTNQNIAEDFALAQVLPGIPLLPPANIQTISQRQTPANFPIGLPVTMLGGLSGASPGIVRGLQGAIRLPARGNVNFPFWIYSGLILYQVRNLEGDSGSVVLSDNNSAAGIHVAGNGTFGLMYPLRPFTDSKGLELIT